MSIDKLDNNNLSGPRKVDLNTEPLWTVDDLALYLKLEPSTVRSMARDGKLPAMKVGRVWRFKYSELMKFLKDG